MFVLSASAGAACGAFLVWVQMYDWNAERGKHVVPESIEYRSYWVHNGHRFYYEQDDDPYLPPLRLGEPIAVSGDGNQ